MQAFLKKMMAGGEKASDEYVEFRRRKDFSYFRGAIVDGILIVTNLLATKIYVAAADDVSVTFAGDEVNEKEVAKCVSRNPFVSQVNSNGENE